MAKQKIIAAILAAGKSRRFGANKLQSLLGQQTVLETTLAVFKRMTEIDKLIVMDKGGGTRQETTYMAVEKIEKSLNPNRDDLIIFHNAANPLVTEKEITQCVKEAKKHGAAIVAHKVKDTIKMSSGKQISKTIDRALLWAAQTPQVFKWQLIKRAVDFCKKNNLKVTDEASLLEACGEKVYIVEASANNNKITLKEDLEYTKFLFGDYSKSCRVGIGQDSHSFDEKKKGMVLGGVLFSECKAFKANSDGDVILHALSNAISSAMGEASFSLIADPLCKKGVKDSGVYLAKIINKMSNNKYVLQNVSISLEGAQPKLESKIAKIKTELGKTMNLPESSIGITITSGEKLTPFGEGKGLQCIAVVALRYEN